MLNIDDLKKNTVGFLFILLRLLTDLADIIEIFVPFHYRDYNFSCRLRIDFTIFFLIYYSVILVVTVFGHANCSPGYIASYQLPASWKK